MSKTDNIEVVGPVGDEGVRILKGNRIVRSRPHKPAEREVKLDEEGNPYTTKHPSSGQRGRMLKLNFKDGSTETYLRKPVAREAQKGMQRQGVQAKDLAAEAVYTNEKTSPRIEVPRLLVETLRMDVSKLRASDVAIWWRLFAEARLAGLSDDTHYIQLSSLARYLGIRSLDRVKSCITRLSTAELSIHGRAGRKFEVMLECPDAEDLASMSGSDWLHYSLPLGLRDAVLNATGFTRIDLNALARFKSKFSAALYIRLCYEAGKTKDFHDDIHLGMEDFKRIVGLDAGQAEVIQDTVERVREDLMTIDGPRRRFHIDAFVSNTRKLVIGFGGAQMRLLETRPAYMTGEGIKALADRSLFKLLPHQYPAIVRLRQAETLLKVRATTISELWRLDVQRACGKHPEGCLGYTAKGFRARIRKLGADAVFAEWIEKRDFPEAWGVVREELPPVQKFVREVREPKRQKKAQPKPLVAKFIVVEGEDLRVGDELGVLEYGDEPTPDFGPADAETDDSDIPF